MIALPLHGSPCLARTTPLTALASNKPWNKFYLLAAAPLRRTGWRQSGHGGRSDNPAEINAVDLLVNEKQFIGSIGGSCAPDRDFPRFWNGKTTAISDWRRWSPNASALIKSTKPPMHWPTARLPAEPFWFRPPPLTGLDKTDQAVFGELPHVAFTFGRSGSSSADTG